MPVADDPQHEASFAAIIEGRCPRCLARLERREECGWCEACQRGWAARTATAADVEGIPGFQVGEHLIWQVLVLDAVVPPALRGHDEHRA